MIKEDIELLFAKKLMKLMEETFEMLYYSGNNEKTRKFELLIKLSSLTTELINDEEIFNKMKKVAESSQINGDNIEDKFNTFKMIRNVVQHFPIFDSWEEIYISTDLLDWNNPNGNQIKKYFNSDKEFSYKIFLKEEKEWIQKREINIKTPKLGKYNKIYLKDILSLDDALWTFGAIDYYLQLLGLEIETRFIISL